MDKVSEYKDYIYKIAALNDDIEFNPIQQRILDNPSNSMIFAHPVGSGKTLSGIAKFEKLKEEGKANKALVVTPASLRTNFDEEGVKKFTNSTSNIIGNKMEIAKHQGNLPNKDADYNIISYEMFRKNPSEIIDQTGADTIILDEMHKLKNEGTSTLDAFKDIRGKYNNLIGLTGSVISNKPSDIYNLVDLASQGNHSLGKDKEDFEKMFYVRSNRPEYRGMREERIPITGFKNKKVLKKELKKYVDYADIDDVRDIAKIPNKNIKRIEVPLSKEQAKYYKMLVEDDPKLYDLIRRKRLETLKDDELARAFNIMTEARKLSNSVATVTPGMTLSDSAEQTPKVKKLLDDMENHLNTTDDGQAILLTNLINGGADVLEAGLNDRGVEYGKFIGKGNKGVTEESRQQDVRDYKDRLKRVMLISGAGGEGISLGNTTWEGSLDGHYNPEKMNQMEARGIRAFGLPDRPEEDKNVEVNRYISTMPRTLGIFKSKYKTPDEMIYEIADKKEKQNQLLYKLLQENNKQNLLERLRGGKNERSES